MSANIPPFRWAENDNELWVTIEVPTAKSSKLDLTEDSFKYTASENGKDYSLEFALKGKIDTKESSFAVKDREVEIRLVKAEDNKGWWNKLTPDAANFKQHMKVDWDLWADEDDDEVKAPDADFGMGGMGGMPGMDGMGGGNFDLASLMAQMQQGGMGGMPGMEGMDFSQLAGMGGMGGMPGMEGMDFGGEGDEAGDEAEAEEAAPEEAAPEATEKSE